MFTKQRHAVVALASTICMSVAVSGCGCAADDHLDRYEEVRDRLDLFEPGLCGTVSEESARALDVWPGSPSFSNSGLYAVCRTVEGDHYVEVRVAWGGASMNGPFFVAANTFDADPVDVEGADHAAVADKPIIVEREDDVVGFTLAADVGDDFVQVVSSGTPRDPERLAAAVDIAEAAIALRGDLTTAN